MRFTCDTQNLRTAVNIVSRAVAVKSPIPAAEGILFECSSDSLRLTAYDMKRGIYTNIPVQAEQAGNIVLPTRMLSEIVRLLPGDTMTLNSDDKLNVRITSGKSVFDIIGISSDDYPELPSVEFTDSLTLPQNLLGDMIRRTIFAVSNDEARPIYTGSLFELEGDELTVVSIDGYRMALRREKVNPVEKNYHFVVPGRALSDLEKFCGDEGDVRIVLGPKHISFSLNDTVLVTRRLEGSFLDYKKALPVSFALKASLQRADLQRAVERVSLVVDEKVKTPLRCVFHDDRIDISCSAPTGKADDTCQAVIDGSSAKLEIGFNHRFMLDALKAAPVEELVLCLNNGSSPCVIKNADGSENFVFMILPVRLRAE